MIRNTENNNLLSNKFRHNDWRENPLGVVEAIVLLELIMILKKKGREIRRGKIIIGIDNKHAHKKISKEV